MIAAPIHLQELLPCLRWEVAHSYRFDQTSHINLQEFRGVKAVLTHEVQASLSPLRLCVCIDSCVALGALGKARLSSIQLNGLLRSFVGWCVLGRKRLQLIWVSTHHNPADHPSRNVPIPPPTVSSNELVKEILRRLPGGEPTPLATALEAGLVISKCAVPSVLPTGSKREPTLTACRRRLCRSGDCLEVFAGRGGLTRAMRQVLSVRVADSLNIFPLRKSMLIVMT